MKKTVLLFLYTGRFASTGSMEFRGRSGLSYLGTVSTVPALGCGEHPRLPLLVVATFPKRAALPPWPKAPEERAAAQPAPLSGPPGASGT